MTDAQASQDRLLMLEFKTIQGSYFIIYELEG